MTLCVPNSANARATESEKSLSRTRVPWAYARATVAPSDFRRAGGCGTTTGVVTPVAVASCGRLAPSAAAAATKRQKGPTAVKSSASIDSKSIVTRSAPRARDELEQPERIDQPLGEEVEVVGDSAAAETRRLPAALARARIALADRVGREALSRASSSIRAARSGRTFRCVQRNGGTHDRRGTM